MKDFTKDSAKAWFEARVAKLIRDAAGTAQAWAYAVEHFPEHGDQTPWRDWVIGAISDSKGKAHTNPAGLLLSIIADGPREHAAKPAHKPIRPRSNMTQGQKDAIDESRKLRAAGLRQPSMPSSIAICALRKTHGYLGAFNIVRAEWEAQGQPYPDAFDWHPLGIEQPQAS